ncbi:hypothetical protein GCK72_008843 [Caenorhabditis remanei]|uniref:Uncharacterized protein n=1 Tax=Caenorhabditis remanei TaxID=31234 RepID=A0A6A5H294_CAERE|nr:hypothetical protein GCK72_008841 [Caenorhabditis remanei]XP_053586655.1 hypothetical protein GCK72_008843 [Caenorhabditis remanei]KAF1760592.1 hypothetical protein GCK72_008841 [Caenorhabditis remanei]KAF1760594.1 hypothetical protein GCK72_008843 [Caenorhabditis remanei]
MSSFRSQVPASSSQLAHHIAKIKGPRQSPTRLNARKVKSIRNHVWERDANKRRCSASRPSRLQNRKSHVDLAHLAGFFLSVMGLNLGILGTMDIAEVKSIGIPKPVLFWTGVATGLLGIVLLIIPGFINFCTENVRCLTWLKLKSFCLIFICGQVEVDD